MSKKEEIQERRLRVLEFYIEGLETKKIAEFLSCSIQTIRNDLKVLLEENPSIPLKTKYPLRAKTKERRVEVLRLYQEGWTIIEIAQKLNCARQTVVYDLKTLREEDPTISSRRRSYSKTEIEERRAEILRLTQNGLKAKMIAKILGIAYYIVSDDLNVLGKIGKLQRQKKSSRLETKKRLAKVLALYNEGLIPEEIAERLRCHVRKIYADLDALGL